MSKKNNKSNKKKSVRGNYKIEALEPRLMMDGDPTGSEQQWLSEVNQYKDSYNDIMSESYRSLNAKIDGLYVAKDDNVSPATYKSLLDLRDNVGGIFAALAGTPFSEQMEEVVDSVKSDLKSCIKWASVGKTKVSAQDILDWCGAKERVLYNGAWGKKTSYHVSLYDNDKLKSYYYSAV